MKIDETYMTTGGAQTWPNYAKLTGYMSWLKALTKSEDFEPFLGPQRGGSTEPTTPVVYMDGLRMFKVFFWFYSLHFLVYNNNENSWKYNMNTGGAQTWPNCAKLPQIDRMHFFAKGCKRHQKALIKSEHFEPVMGPQRGGHKAHNTCCVHGWFKGA